LREVEQSLLCLGEEFHFGTPRPESVSRHPDPGHNTKFFKQGIIPHKEKEPDTPFQVVRKRKTILPKS
jgi:hypothetical protein